MNSKREPVQIEGTKTGAAAKKQETAMLKALDPGIREVVRILREEGVFTIESCQSGEGHAYPEPCVRIGGNSSDGYYALSVAISYGMPIDELRRVWSVDDGELVGPDWWMTFVPGEKLRRWSEWRKSQDSVDGSDAK